MPKACNRLMVRRRWLRRALAFRCCVKANCAAMVSAYGREQRPPLAHKGASHAVAVRTWHNVRSVFFPSVRLAELAEKHMANAAQNQVPLNRKELAHLEVVHAQFCFTILERPFDRPAGERHPQEGLDRRIFGGVTDEVLDLLRIQGISRDQQMMRPRGQAIFIGQVDQHTFDLPTIGPLVPSFTR